MVVVVRDAAAHILTAVDASLVRRLPAIAGGLAEEISAEDAAYAALVEPAELRETILHNLRHATASMRARSANRPVDLSDATRTGRIRAEQGLPLASLQQAYRRGCRLLWQAMVETVQEEDPDSLPELLPCVGDLWDIVDLMTGAVAAAYQKTESERLARDIERRNALFDVLLGGPGADLPAGGGAGLVAEASAFLGLAEHGRYAVAVVRSDGRGVGSAQGGPRTDGFQVMWRIRADHEVGLITLGSGDLGDAVRALGVPGVRAGVSPVVGSPAELVRARWLAEIALQTCVAAGDEVVVLDQRLPAALVAAQSDLAERLRTVVLGPVLRLPRAERELLLATLTAWFDAGGSAQVTAGALFCHRNTVLNRLRRIEELTGRSIGDPRQMVELALAVEAARR